MNERQVFRLLKDEEGAYHWGYSLPMFRNFSILRTVLKAITIIIVFPYAFLLFAILSRGSTSDLGWVIRILAICMVVAYAIAFGCYFLVAAFYGGTYIQVYTLDNKSLIVEQPTGQQDKSRIIGILTSAAGAITDNAGLIPAGMLIGGRLIVETKLTDIISLKMDPEKNEIRVHSFLTWYSIYVSHEDFDYVSELLTQRCVNAKVVHL